MFILPSLFWIDNYYNVRLVNPRRLTMIEQVEKSSPIIAALMVPQSLSA